MGGKFLFLVSFVVFFSSFSKADISDTCIQYPITFWYNLYAQGKTSFMANCPDVLGQPIRGGGAIPDTSQEYADQVLRGLSVVTDCLQLPIKEIMPLIKGESGFVLNSVGPSFDAGIGQLTESAIRDVDFHLNDLAKYLQVNSSNPNCQAIINNWQMVTAHQDADLAHRCEFLAGPTNPFKNILWTGFYIKILNHEVSGNIEDRRLDQTLLQLNFPQDRINDLIHILTYLSYNQGSAGSVNLLAGYLKGLINGSVTNLTIDQFDFTQDLSWLDKIDKTQWKSIPINNLSFPAYVKIYTTIGNPQYLHSLYAEVLDYDKNVGQSVCTPDDLTDFLKL